MPGDLFSFVQQFHSPLSEKSMVQCITELCQTSFAKDVYLPETASFSHMYMYISIWIAEIQINASIYKLF